MRYPLALLCASLILWSCQAPSPEVTAEQETAVRAQIEASVSGLREAMNQGTAEDVLAFYRLAPDFVYLGCTDYILGGQTFSSLVSPYYQGETRETFEMGVVAIQVLGPDAAVASVRGGSGAAPDLFWTQVWVRDGGEWKIAVEHESWPDCAQPRDPHPFTSAPDSAALRSDRTEG